MTETQRIVDTVWERQTNHCVRTGEPYRPIILHTFPIEDYPRAMDLNLGPDTSRGNRLCSETPVMSIGGYRGLVISIVIEVIAFVLVVAGWLVCR